MIADVSAILKEIGGRIDIDGGVQLSDIDFLGEMYRFEKPLSIKGHISNTGKSLILRAKCGGTMITRCARCMKDIEVPVEFDIDENLIRAGEDVPDDDATVFDGTVIDIDDIVSNSFLMNVEGKYLCSESCRGLCNTCGADLNEGECGCHTETVDPRWAALIDIMEKDK